MNWTNPSADDIGEYVGNLLKPYGFNYVLMDSSPAGLINLIKYPFLRKGSWIIYEGTVEEYDLFIENSLKESPIIIELEQRMFQGDYHSNKGIVGNLYVTTPLPASRLGRGISFHLYWRHRGEWRFVDIMMARYDNGKTVAGHILHGGSPFSEYDIDDTNQEVYLFTPIGLISKSHYMNWLDENPLEVKE